MMGSWFKTKIDKIDALFKTKIPKNIPWLAVRPLPPSRAKSIMFGLNREASDGEKEKERESFPLPIVPRALSTSEIIDGGGECVSLSDYIVHF